MLYYATYAYNTAYHSAIKDTPYYLMYLNDPIHPTHENENNTQIDLNNYKQVAIAMQRAAFERVQRHLDHDRPIREANYIPSKTTEITEGSRIFIFTPPLPNQTKKFAIKYKGPMRLHKILGPNTIVVKRLSNQKMYKVHLKNIKIINEQDLSIQDVESIRKAYIDNDDDELEIGTPYLEHDTFNPYQGQESAFPIPGPENADSTLSDTTNILEQLNDIAVTKPTRMKLRSHGPVDVSN